MTDKKKSEGGKALPNVTGLSSFHVEADRTNEGMCLVICGIIGISDFSDSFILLLSHGGRVSVTGKRLNISVFESGSVEIRGRVEVVNFGYGKN